MEPWMRRLEEMRVSSSSRKPIPKFDGREPYWWLIQLHQYFEDNKILEEMKVMRVTLFALSGEALEWWSLWKQSNQKPTWKIFEKAVIKKFIPDLWACLQVSEDEEQENKKEEEGLMTQIQSNLGEHEILDKKQDEAMTKSHEEEKGIVETEEKILVEGVIEKHGGSSDVETEGMSSKTEPASTVAWVSSKPYGPPPPSLKYKPEPPKGSGEVWRRRPPKALKTVNRGGISSDEALRWSDCIPTTWFRCFAVESEGLGRRRVAEIWVPHEGPTRQPPPPPEPPDPKDRGAFVVEGGDSTVWVRIKRMDHISHILGQAQTPVISVIHFINEGTKFGGEKETSQVMYDIYQQLGHGFELMGQAHIIEGRSWGLQTCIIDSPADSTAGSWNWAQVLFERMTVIKAMIVAFTCPSNLGIISDLFYYFGYMIQEQIRNIGNGGNMGEDESMHKRGSLIQLAVAFFPVVTACNKSSQCALCPIELASPEQMAVDIYDLIYAKQFCCNDEIVKGHMEMIVEVIKQRFEAGQFSYHLIVAEVSDHEQWDPSESKLGILFQILGQFVAHEVSKNMIPGWRQVVLLLILCFLAKSNTQNRAFDPGGSSSTSGITWSLYFKLWDPGGIYFFSIVHLLHLEDKVKLLGGVLLGPGLLGPLLM